MDDSHLFYFSARSLTRLLVDGGFRVLKVCEGLRPYRFSREYNREVPLWLYDGGERLISLLQIKTGMGIIARLA